MRPADALDGESRLPDYPEALRAALQVFVEHRLLLSDTGNDGQVWLTPSSGVLIFGVVHQCILVLLTV
jgi:hypothetical protein